MNRYYHEVELGFNSWMILILVAIAAMIIVGSMQYILARNKNGRYIIRKRYADRVINVTNAVLTAIFAIIFVNDSWRGVLQILDNHLAVTDSPAWSIILFPLAIVVFIGVFAAFCYLVGKIASLARIGILYKRMQNKYR